MLRAAKLSIMNHRGLIADNDLYLKSHANYTVRSMDLSKSEQDEE